MGDIWIPVPGDYMKAVETVVVIGIALVATLAVGMTMGWFMGESFGYDEGLADGYAIASDSSESIGDVDWRVTYTGVLNSWEDRRGMEFYWGPPPESDSMCQHNGTVYSGPLDTEGEHYLASFCRWEKVSHLEIFLVTEGPTGHEFRVMLEFNKNGSAMYGSSQYGAFKLTRTVIANDYLPLT